MPRTLLLALAALVAASLLALLFQDRGATDARSTSTVDSSSAAGSSPGSTDLVAPRAEEARTAETSAATGPAEPDDEDARVSAATSPDRGTLLVRFEGAAVGSDDALPGPDFELIAKGVANGKSFDATAALGDDGVVRFTDLPSDSAWRVHLVARRFVDRNVPAPLVRPGETAEVVVPLERGVGVRGRVVDEKGDPVPGAQIAMRSWKHFDARILTGRNVGGKTDEDGRFDLGGLLAGDVVVNAHADGYLSAREELGRSDDGEVVEDVELRLDSGRRLTGTVLWPGGNPAGGADVRVVGQGRTWGHATTATADADGRFEVQGLRSGPWRVGAWSEHADTDVLWRAVVDPVTAGDVTLTLEEGARVTGHVVDDAGTPIRSARVTATPVGVGGGATPIKERFKDDAGAFEIEGLGEGTWDLTAYAKGHGKGAPTRVVVPLDADGASVVVPRLASVAGEVVDAAGQPVAGAKVRAAGRSDTTADDGTFSITKVQPGELVLQVSGGGDHGPPAGEPIVLAPGEERTGAVVVLSVGATVLGEIHPSARTGTELTVVLQPHDSYMSTKTVVDAEGRFTFTGVAPGRYRVAFDWTGVGDWVEGYRVRKEVLVELREGETERVVLGDPERRTTVVRGETREGGMPTAGLLMYVFDVEGPQNQPLMVARSDDDGRYEFELARTGPTLFTVGYGQQRQARFVRELTGAPEQTIDFDLPGHVLRGRLVHESGAPVTPRIVMLTHADAPPGTVQLGQAQFTMSKGDGSFAFEGLHPGEYRLRSGNYVKAHATDALVVREGIVVPDEGDPPDIEVVIGDGAVLDVRAVDGGGEPLSQRRVEVLDAAGWPSVLYDERSTDYAGSQRFTGLTPGHATAVVYGRDGDEIGRSEVELEPGRQAQVTVVCDRR